MSKALQWFVCCIAVVLVAAVGGGATMIAGQSPGYAHVQVRIDPATSKAFVTGKFTARPRKNLVFAASPIGAATGSDQRLSELTGKAANGSAVEVRRFSGTEFVAAQEVSTFNFAVDLRPGSDARTAAHRSWIDAASGIIFPDDVLPLPFASESRGLHITLELPDGWRISATEPTSGVANTFYLADIHRAVFALGRDSRTSDGVPRVVIGGKWFFPDDTAFTTARDLYGEYKKIFGGEPSTRPLVVLMPFPGSNAPRGTWEAETRGSTVVLLSADTPFEGQSVQRLHEQLRHELFHLWIPNGVELTGNYDWFFEGFALYQSLRTAVALNRIRFDDMLDTLSRARSIDLAAGSKAGLPEASKARFSGNETILYARGVIAAFVADVAILNASKGRRSVADVSRTVFTRHRKGSAAVDGNEAVLRIMSEYKELGPVVERFIQGPGPGDWREYLAMAGLVDASDGRPPSRLSVKERPGRRERELLDKLGYNNWRNLSK